MEIHQSGQIIATSDEVTPKGGWVREIRLFQANLGWWIITLWSGISDFHRNFLNQNMKKKPPSPLLVQEVTWIEVIFMGTKGEPPPCHPPQEMSGLTMGLWNHWFPLGSHVFFWIIHDMKHPQERMKTRLLERILQSSQMCKLNIIESPQFWSSLLKSNKKLKPSRNLFVLPGWHPFVSFFWGRNIDTKGPWVFVEVCQCQRCQDLKVGTPCFFFPLK